MLLGDNLVAALDGERTRPGRGRRPGEHRRGSRPARPGQARAAARSYGGDIPVVHREAGGDLVVASSDRQAELLSRSGTLGDVPAFSRALPDLADAEVAVWVDPATVFETLFGGDGGGRREPRADRRPGPHDERRQGDGDLPLPAGGALISEGRRELRTAAQVVVRVGAGWAAGRPGLVARSLRCPGSSSARTGCTGPAARATRRRSRPTGGSRCSPLLAGVAHRPGRLPADQAGPGGAADRRSRPADCWAPWSPGASACC